MKKVSQVLFAMLFLYSFAAKAETQASPLCPTLDLNTTTLHYHEYMINILFTGPEYKDRFSHIGIITPVSFDELRLLETETDSAVCQKLNERLELPGRYKYDRELKRYVTELYVTYYELRGQYLVFQQPYSAGSNVEGVIGPIDSGWIIVRAYDKKNLNFVGGVTF